MAKSSSKKMWIFRIVTTLVVGVALLISVIGFEDKINGALGLTKVSETKYEGTTSSEVIELGGEMSVHFVDVGQGDACIVELPDDKTILIDGGDKDSEVADNLLAYIENYIKTDDGKTIEYFDYAILTHPDADHCGSMDKVLNEYPAKNFYRPNVLATYKGFTDPGKANLISGYGEKETREYMSAIEAGHQKDTNIFINSIDLDPIVPLNIDEDDKDYYKLSFYGPESPSYADWNDYSPIMILEYQNYRFALTGDCEKEGEAQFTENVEDAETDGKTDKFDEFDDNYFVDVIKLGHHGSSTSTSPEFVDVITTSTSVENTLLIVSCGFDNKYGHPHDSKIKELLKTGFKEENILRTDKNGSIVLSVRQDEGGEYKLYHGANAMVKSQETSIDWRYIAICLFGAVFFVMIIYPLTKGKIRYNNRRRSRN